MELDAWAESDIPGSRWCDWETSCASVRNLRGFREVVVAVRLALLVGRCDRCVDSEGRVWSVKRSNSGRPRVRVGSIACRLSVMSP